MWIWTFIIISDYTCVSQIWSIRLHIANAIMIQNRVVVVIKGDVYVQDLHAWVDQNKRQRHKIQVIVLLSLQGCLITRDLLDDL